MLYEYYSNMVQTGGLGMALQLAATVEGTGWRMYLWA
jgi:hypothetical protein